MAAPYKQGIDYFSYYIGLIKDKKFRTLRKEYGAWVVLAYLALLEMIYFDKGYYIEYNENTKDDVIWELSEYLEGKYQPKPETIEEVIEGFVACGLFSGDHYSKQKILTSKRIQLTYYSSTIKRKIVNVIKSIWFLPIETMMQISKNSPILKKINNDGNNEVNDGNNEVNDGINPQSKRKESKRNESKVVVTLPLKNGGEQVITEDDTKQLQLTYKNIDVITSLRKLALYVAEHPDKRRSNYSPYIALWLNEDNKQRASNTKNAENASYNLEEYERYSMFDDE